MSLPHALLTSLLEKPSSGLELARRFDRSIGYFWQATHQQIYRELGRLEQAGWVESEADEGARGRKRSYKVLPAGRAELQRWLGTQAEVKPLKDEMMVRLRAEAVVGENSQLETEIARHLEAHHAQLANYRRIEKRDFLNRELSKADRLQYLVLKAGIEYEQMCINLTSDALTLLSD